MSNLSDKKCGDVIIALTASWRYFACASILAFICQLALFICSFTEQIYLFVGIVIFIINHYFIFRLWLDKHFFKILYRQDDNHCFDLALQEIFPKKQVAISMEKRWNGTKKLFNYALSFVILYWFWILTSIFMINK
ncbi:hypothetical protein [Providencia burhodogranariea]|uniref:Uncharacterized protein n=1 Tax=Providencia burhodogranariea DSM 19968 TaxID=1141662 RepID=K8WRU1_9GAMM|nr:hypothetical protein [Providencia burhodogranariea]EKT62686.1 hypothetical protein OOA_06726 [Providencia burhodogranariea DSM 19968]